MATRRGLGLAVIGVALLMVGCGSTAAPATRTPSAFSALSGKSFPGAPSSWLAIANPYVHPADVGGTVTPPVLTGGTGTDGASSDTVAFFDFANSGAASAFYNDPPLAARMTAKGILAYVPLTGATGVPAPSRGLDLRACLWAGGPNQGGSSGRGTSSGGTLLASGQCSQGTASSMGVGTIIQRGAVVVLVETVETSVIGGSADPSELTQNVTLATSALQLLQSVGLS